MNESERLAGEKAFMHVIWTLIIGLVAGAVAKLLVPGKDPGGWVVTMLLGLAGSFVARWIGVALGYYQPGARVGFFASVLGAIIILVVYHLIRRIATHQQTPRPHG